MYNPVHLFAEHHPICFRPLIWIDLVIWCILTRRCLQIILNAVVDDSKFASRHWHQTMLIQALGQNTHLTTNLRAGSLIVFAHAERESYFSDQGNERFALHLGMQLTCLCSQVVGRSIKIRAHRACPSTARRIHGAFCGQGWIGWYPTSVAITTHLRWDALWLHVIHKQ